MEVDASFLFVDDDFSFFFFGGFTAACPFARFTARSVAATPVKRSV